MPWVVFVVSCQEDDDAVHGMEQVVDLPEKEPQVITVCFDTDAPVCCVTILTVNAVHVFLIVQYDLWAINLHFLRLGPVESPDLLLVFGCN